MTAVLDTNVIVRHLTYDPPDQGQAATAYLAAADHLVLPDVIAAETVYVLQSYYRAPKDTIAAALRALVAMGNVRVERPEMLLRAIDLFEIANFDFADAYVVAYAQTHGISQIASFDKGIDKRLVAAAQAAPGTPPAISRLDPSGLAKPNS
ncbi:MAG: type II toxin-antitoxin system VapC family toxin [Bifidobacteriaceae bacterium]|jgi:predicted nucleic acid-binding protein|nr:type II toxin-antitoxin system VapC family toxin [Bifidobacteriaceae bacterium]